MKPFERLRAWQAAHALFISVYRVTATWPPFERYGLTAQLRRSSLSAGSNLAEGVVRRTPRDFARFIEIALGSLSELSYQMIAAKDVGLLSDGEYATLEEQWAAASKLTWRLYRGVRKRAPD